jgi:hypothetical protein
MAIWPFNRNKKSSTLGTTSIPSEVQDYYNAQHRERVGVAWLIAVVSLLASIAVVVGLFFGGRWAYRKIAHKNPSGPVAVQEDDNKSDESKDEDKNKSDSNDSNSSDNSSQGSNQPQSLPGSDDSSDAAAGTTTPQTSSTSTTTPQAATTGKTPDTGPGNTIAVFAIATVAGTTAYQVALRRRTAS